MPTSNKVGHVTNDASLTTLAAGWTGGGSNTAGESLVCFVTWVGSATTDMTNPTDNGSGNTWSIKKTLSLGGGVFAGVAIALSASAVSTINANFGVSVTFTRVQILSVTNGPIFDVADGNVQAGTEGTGANAITSQSGSTATTIDGDLIIGWIIDITSATLPSVGTSPLSFTSRDSYTTGDGDCGLLQTATQTTHGPVASTATTTAGTDTVASIVVALAAAAVSTSPILMGGICL